MRFRGTYLALLPLVVGPNHLWGQFSHEIEQTSIVAEGAFSIDAGTLRYWASDLGYIVHTLDSNTEQVIGFPAGSGPAERYAPSTAAFDAESELFYVMTHAASGLRYVSVYDESSDSWLLDDPTLSGFTDTYGASLYDGQLTVAGRAQAWNSEGTVEQYIFNIDLDSSETGTTRHDALILTEDVSGVIAYGPDGSLYYATKEAPAIYCWSAEQIATVKNDFELVSIDSYLLLSSGQKLLDLPGYVGGITVDEKGALFFTMNLDNDHPEQVLAQYRSDLEDGYQVLVRSEDEVDDYGEIAIEGAFSEGGLLYFSPGKGQGLVRVGGPRFSMGFDDNDNPYDAPIPGFVGTGGEGKTSVEGYEDSDNAQNYVNPLFIAWASEWIDYSPASVYHGNGTTYNVEPFWQYPDGTLGPVTGDNFDVASLGDQDAAALDAGEAPGTLTIRFADPILNLSGADFAVFENGFISLVTTGTGSIAGGMFAELAYVEVSSNGEDFARFPSVSNTPSLVGAYGSVSPEKIFNLAGKHCNAYGESWGTPFDLSYLKQDPLVLNDTVDLNAITHIRVVDIPGNGSFLDSLGQPIYDAWVTWGSGGADIEAFGAISQELTYAKWIGERNLTMDGDKDGDGLINLLEYAFYLNPELADATAPTSFISVSEGVYEFTFPRDERIVDLRYIVEGCLDLAGISPKDWQAVLVLEPMSAPFVVEANQIASVAAVAIESASPQASVGVLQTIRVQLNMESKAQAFFRLRVETVE